MRCVDSAILVSICQQKLFTLARSVEGFWKMLLAIMLTKCVGEQKTIIFLFAISNIWDVI